MSDDQPTYSMLRVCNRNKAVQADMFDGVPYCFMPKEPVDLSPEAALHIFGYAGGEITDDLRRSMMRHACRRWGLNTPEHLKANLDYHWFKNFDFKPVTFAMQEVGQHQHIPSPEETASPVAP